MESSEALAIESFSHSWLTSVKSSLHGLEMPLRASLDSTYEDVSEESRCKMVKSRRTVEEDQNFNFGFPTTSQPHHALLHADQLFSDGLIRPVFINQSKMEGSSSQNLVPAVPPFCSRTVSSVHNNRYRWKRILPRCYGYVKRLLHCVGGSRIRVDNVERITWEAKNTHQSKASVPQVYPRTHSLDACFDSESSIHEAVLHCKRSMVKKEEEHSGR